MPAPPSRKESQPLMAERPRLHAQPTYKPVPTSARPGTARQSTPKSGSSSSEENAFESHGRSLPLPHLFVNSREADDLFHSAGPRVLPRGAARLLEDGKYIRGHSVLVSCRGCVNLCALLFMILATLAIFLLWPLSEILKKKLWTPVYTGDYGTQFFNSSFNGRGLVDARTPDAARTIKGVNGETLTLVFSDEFEEDGRTFYPGDDPYFTAPSLHYWSTGDSEVWCRTRTIYPS
jgi:hypothetical protein